jgi:hypothetical protein
MSANHLGVRGSRAVTAAALALIVLGCAIGVAVPAGLGWDFANFYDAGHRVVAGQADDLYHKDRPIGGEPPQGQMRFWGAPLSAVLFAPLALLPPGRALPAFKLENVIALALAMLLLFRHSRRFIADDARHRSLFAAAFAVLCLLYQPFWTIFRVGGQSTPTVLLALVVSLFCYMSSSFRMAALLLAGAAMVKPSLVVMLVFLAGAADVAFLIALIIVSVFLGLLSVIALGWPIHLEFLGVLVEGTRVSRPWHFNSSLYVPLENFRLLMNPDAATALMLTAAIWCVKLSVAGMLIVILRRSRRTEWPMAARRHFEFVMAICFWLLTSQTVWEHYLAMLFVPLCYMVAMWRYFPAPGQRLIVSIFVLAMGQNLVLMEWLWTRFDIRTAAFLIAIGLFKAGPLLLMAIVLWRYRNALFASYRAPEWTGPRTVVAAARTV